MTQQTETTDCDNLDMRVWYDGYGEHMPVFRGDDYAKIAADWVADGDWGDGDCRISYSWAVSDADGDIVDEGSGDHEQHTPEPECPDHDSHDWTSEHEGGCSDNPGVWSTGGTSMCFVSHCKNCGMRREEKTTGSQRNPGECDTTTYGEPDAEWLAEYGYATAEEK